MDKLKRLLKKTPPVPLGIAGALLFLLLLYLYLLLFSEVSPFSLASVQNSLSAWFLPESRLFSFFLLPKDP